MIAGGTGEQNSVATKSISLEKVLSFLRISQTKEKSVKFKDQLNILQRGFMNIRVKMDNYNFPNIGEVRENFQFEIYWEHDGLFYPMEHWVDFGCILVGWWVSTVIKLLRGNSEGSFAFMDGPYSLLAKLDQNTQTLSLQPRGMNITWEMNFTELLVALSQAVSLIHEKLIEREVSEEDKTIFRRYSEILQESLLKI